MRKRSQIGLLSTGVLFCNLITGGCGTNTAITDIKIGSKLYDDKDQLIGTVIKVEDSHKFGNGFEEPGMLIEFGARANSPVPQEWMPSRAAGKFVVR